LSLALAEKRQTGTAMIALDILIMNKELRRISKADIVISMLPAHIIAVARDCIGIKKFSNRVIH
jgi:hypothetical protein